MIPSAHPCGASRYVKKMIKICEWVKNEKSALNLLCRSPLAVPAVIFSEPPSLPSKPFGKII